MKTSSSIPRSIVVLFVVSLALNVGLFVYVLFTATKNTPSPKDYPLLDAALGFRSKKDLIVNLEPLRQELIRIGKENDVSIYFEFLNTGANISVNKDSAFWPASLMKIPVGMAVMRKIEKGEWSFDNELLLLPEDKNSEFGELYRLPDNSRFTVERLLREMLVNSDNTARSIFMRNLDFAEIQVVLDHLGIEDIFNSDLKIQTKKYSIFWRSLYTASFLSPENSQKLIELMSQSSATKYLRRGIPENIMFSHKIGVSGDTIYSDSGIVYAPNRPYILTVMLSKPSEADATALMEEISRKVYSYVSEY